MKIIRARLKSVTPYSQSKAVGVEKQANENHDDYEKRTWPERVHCSADGSVYIPPMSFKKSIDAAAKYLALKVSGGRGATYSKHVESGTFIMDPIVLPLKKADVPGEWLFLDANGKKGKASSGRVMRCMPRIDQWEGTLTIHVLDEKVLNSSEMKGRDGRQITVLEQILRTAGSLIGVGRFRPENGGFYGRFIVAGFEIAEADDASS